MLNESENHKSFVHGIRVATPCKADWNAMTGDERARFCHSCKLNVYNISAMTTEEAEQLIMEKEGNLCVRIYRRKDGTVITQDCPRGLEALRKRYFAAIASVTALLAAGAMFFLQRAPQTVAKENAIQKVNVLVEQAKSNVTSASYSDAHSVMGGAPAAYDYIAPAPAAQPEQGKVAR